MLTSASAQDMRIYTSVSDVSKGAPRVVSHSLTLFHAGKVYDYMDETGEVVIFEPVHHRFVILAKDYRATEVPFSELNHFLESARTESLTYISKLNAQENSNAARLEALVRFQLAPAFQESQNESKQTLELASEHLTYNVKTAKIESTQFVRQYLDYADWAARLNFVLRPNSTYPEARLKLNDSLRKLELLPTQVDLQLQMTEPVRLRAEHQFAWEFLSIDRSNISSWERTLQSDRVRWVPFQQYQQQSVVQKSR
ncbi:hypothetical protein SH661x_004133 [Planctomicrobium sp. SH661]|uniref:hypothetical protein n=1 Tax=Planctomicrobium sp. SH661 TaxID=3448124 RepID=UPI003F5C9CE7